LIQTLALSAVILLAGKAVETAKYFLGLRSATIKAMNVDKAVIETINFPLCKNE
jgi:hypothetical protein